MNTEKRNITKELRMYCEPIIESHAFNRLKDITFLGILSPRYSNYLPAGVKSKYWNKEGTTDGNRFDHSIGVSNLILAFCKKLELSDETKKYAICWGLLHDIATWSLSHTGEPAFSKISGVSSKEFRRKVISGDKTLPSYLTVNKQLKDIGVNPDLLINLFEKKYTFRNVELKLLWEIIHSPVTPDTLEGIWRTGKAFSISVPSPSEYSTKISTVNSVSKIDTSIYFEFWKKKSKIYTDIINKADILRTESSWSYSIYKYFQNLNFIETIEISEKEIINRVLENGIISSNSLFKYKTPQQYCVKENVKGLREIEINKLGEYLLKEEMNEKLIPI